MSRSLLFAAALATVVSRAITAAADVPAEIKPPVVVQHVDAVYPPAALADRMHGDVVLTVTVDVDGHVSKVDVFKSGGAALDEAAIVAAREWIFVPAMRNGKPVASRIRMPFHFAPPALAPDLVESPSTPGDIPVHEAVPSEPPAEAKKPPKSSQSVEVVVAGRPSPPSRGPSDFQIPVGQLSLLPHTNAGDLLKLAPGILVTNEGGEGHADSMIIRGFDAGEGEAMALSVGGVPINEPGNFHGNGYSDTHFIIPEAVASLRVVEGPFDPRQGNFAVAGSADYELGLARRGLSAKQTFGTFGTERTLLTWGPEDYDKHTFTAVEYARSNGFGANRAYQKGSALTQYEDKLGSRGLWRVTAQAYSVVARSAGAVREDDYAAGRIGFYDTYDPNQGEDSSRYSVAADIETRDHDVTLAQQVFLISRATRIREDFTGYASDSGAEEPRGAMHDLTVNEHSLGARGSARAHFQAFGELQELEVGYFARGDAVNNVQQLIARATQAPYATDAKLVGTLGNLALYGDASLKPLSWITLRGGLREELFTYVVRDQCREITNCNEDPTLAGNPHKSVATSVLLPRVSLLFGSFGGFRFVGSAGQGVRSLAIDEVVGPATSLARIASYEGGVSYTKRSSIGTLSASSVFYGTRINRDEIFDPTVGRMVETGATTRTGWTGAGRFTGRFFDASLNASAVRGIVNETGAAIAYVPHVMARSETALFFDLPWAMDARPVRVAFGPSFTYVGNRTLPYAQTSDPYLLVDAALKFNWRALELGFVGTNLFDRKYRLSEFTLVSDFHTQPVPTLAPGRVFTAGAPRMLLVSLSGSIGG